MKKTTLLTLAVICTALISCASSQGDSFGYVAPPPTQQDLESNEPGPMQAAWRSISWDYCRARSSEP